MQIVLVPHTHWDREWYQPFAVFQTRLVEMFDGLIELLDNEPRFAHFHLDGQATVFDDYLAVRPEREADLRRLAQTGRISIGPWYTQMDEFLTSGESQIRNLEWGLSRGRSYAMPQPFDGPAFGYLPDQFGHIGQMPQILRSAGITHAVVWRGVPAAIDRSAFWWEAPDGSRILTEYFVNSYGLGYGLSKCADAPALAAEISRIHEIAAPTMFGDALLVPAGGDHTVPAARLAPLLEEASQLTGMGIRMGSIAGFLAEAWKEPPPDDLPRWRGELRSAARAHLLPNVYSNRVHQKRERARVEALLERYAEPLAALVPGIQWPASRLDRAWQLLLWNGAHDSACGCSVDEVAHDVDARYAEARGIAEDIVVEALTALASRAGSRGRLRFNPSPFEREGIPGLGWAVTEWSHGPVQATAIQPGRDGDWVDFDGIRLRITDEDDVGDLYTFCPSNGGVRTGAEEIAVEGDVALFRFAGSSVELRATRREDEPYLRLDGLIDNGRPDHRLMLTLGLPRPVDGSVAVSPFELVSRDLMGEGGPMESPSPTWPARGAVIAGGVGLYTEGVVEYESTPTELSLVLLRAVGTISRGWLATRPSGAGPGLPTPEAQMLGQTPFSLAIEMDAAPERLMATWERFALPLVEAEASGGGPIGGPNGDRDQLLEVEHAVLSAVRRVGDLLEVRVWNESLVPRRARVAGRFIDLGPARIETISL